MKKALHYILPIILILFGLITLFLSTSIVFDWFGIREKEGNYVLFIVWANLISSILYLAAAIGIMKRKKWAVLLLTISVSILVFAFVGFAFYINTGGIYETKTIGAMVFRTTLTLVFTLMTYYILKIKKNEN